MGLSIECTAMGAITTFLSAEKFSPFLKTNTDELFLISNGTAFHSVGAAVERDLVPYVFKL